MAGKAELLLVCTASVATPTLPLTHLGEATQEAYPLRLSVHGPPGSPGSPVPDRLMACAPHLLEVLRAPGRPGAMVSGTQKYRFSIKSNEKVSIFY